MIMQRALSRFSDQRIAVLGVVRNCERTVRGDVLRLFESLRECRELSWLVVESDSSDHTLDVLRTLEIDIPNFRFLSLGPLQPSIPIRTQRIAYCRNVYLEQLRSNPLYSDIDCVVIADLDGVNNLVSAAGFASCWMRNEWDVCTANQRGPYYDIWALRHCSWNPSDCLNQLEFLLSRKVPRESALWAAIYAKMITIEETEDWIEVDSAFGGLAVYRRQALEGAVYSGLDEAGDALCEHVALNSQLRFNGYRIFINPQLINTGYTEHSNALRFAQSLKRRFLGLRFRAKMTVLRGVSGTYKSNLS